MAPETTSGLWVWEALGEAGDLGPDGDRVTATESKPIRAEDEQKGRGYHRAGSVGLQTAPPFRSSVPGTSGAVRWSGRHASAAGGRRSGPGPGPKIRMPGGAAKNKQEAVLLHHASLGREAPPREGNGDRLQYSCLENSMGRGAWWAAVHGVTEGRTLPSDEHFHFLFLQKRN